VSSDEKGAGMVDELDDELDTDSDRAVVDLEDVSRSIAGRSFLAPLLGAVMSACFYGVVCTVPWAPLQRYFLGHPIAVAATMLFWLAIAVLITKWLGTAAQLNQLAAIRDNDLMPSPVDQGAAARWLEQNDSGHVARRWIDEIEQLPSAIRKSLLVTRLQELLTRQSQRGSAKHMADDLRELSARDADAAHDSLGLVRIITWAIPMLGFLGTVIGITQTLGGLDFANGAAAVDNLKSGLYVAFDTTALGLVLSVLAIFIQFPVEQSEQRLLAKIDVRVGHLVSASLPSDDVSDNQTTLIADLCSGVQAAVAESLENQATLWRDTIDEARQQWQTVHDQNQNKIAQAFEQTLIPALSQHAESVNASSQVAGNLLSEQCDRWEDTLSQAHQMVHTSSATAKKNLIEGLDSVLRPALENHAASLDQSARGTADRFDRGLQQCQATVSQNAVTLSSQQQMLIEQYKALTETHRGAESIVAIQQALDANLQRLTETNSAIDRSVAASAGDGMANAMRILARAVDLLTGHLATLSARDGNPSSRRAA
jgi:biopolymer transport protein ExbB/TolQ